VKKIGGGFGKKKPKKMRKIRRTLTGMMLWELKCERCKMTVEEVETCPSCSRFVCDNCKDEYSGLCIDCTLKLANTPPTPEEKEFEKFVKEEGKFEDESELYDEILQELVLQEEEERCCPNCGSDEFVAIKFFENRYKCKNCGYEWME